MTRGFPEWLHTLGWEIHALCRLPARREHFQKRCCEYWSEQDATEQAFETWQRRRREFWERDLVTMEDVRRREAEGVTLAALGNSQLDADLDAFIATKPSADHIFGHYHRWKEPGEFGDPTRAIFHLAGWHPRGLEDEARPRRWRLFDLFLAAQSPYAWLDGSGYSDDPTTRVPSLAEEFATLAAIHDAVCMGVNPIDDRPDLVAEYCAIDLARGPEFAAIVLPRWRENVRDAVAKLPEYAEQTLRAWLADVESELAPVQLESKKESFVNPAALQRRIIELLQRTQEHCAHGDSPEKHGYYMIVSACGADIREGASCLGQLGYAAQAERLQSAFRGVEEHWQGGVYRDAPGADQILSYLTRRYEPQVTDQVSEHAKAEERAYHGAAYPFAVRNLGDVARELAQFLGTVRMTDKRDAPSRAELSAPESPAGAGDGEFPTLDERSPQPTLTADELLILHLLAPLKATMKQVEIARDVRRNRDTVAVCLHRLLELKFVHQPNGGRKGYAITPTGRKALIPH